MTLSPDVSKNTDHGDNLLHLKIHSQFLEIRQALRRMVDWLKAQDIPNTYCRDFEIVLAEAMNNIAEHAYEMAEDGSIEIDLHLDRTGLRCTLIDCGNPMPHGKPPNPERKQLNAPVHDLPEGGFGWSLIRRLTTDMDYRRAAERNILTLRMSFPR